MTKRHDATEAQVRAAQPRATTWLSANAGSGKTRVLTDRVARLLLDDVEPQHILCLTYTKAAASEMQNRLFQRLGAWSMLDAASLHEALDELGLEGQITPEKLREARSLFARAIETPGGLKIQTIHSFCSALLRRFPLEAGVSPQFTEIEDRAADLLRAEIVDTMAEGDESAVLADVAAFFQGEDLSDLTSQIIQHEDAFSKPRSQSDIQALFNLDPEFDPNALPRHVIHANTAKWLQDAADILATESPTMKKLAALLSQVDTDDPTHADLDILYQALLKKEDRQPKFKTIPTKNAKTKLGPLLEPFLALMQRTADAMEMTLSVRAAERTLALHRFATRFLTHYNAQKARRAWLSFDDLIARARALLSDPAVASWVLYRIDGGIDHILVDEAQDTSPAQWDVIRKLAEEFTSGEGTRDNRTRTLFVVGDKKQSIYSFQGADPREFDRMEVEFRQRFEDARQYFQKRQLHYSFRSSQAILRLVDAAFEDATAAGFGDEDNHIAFNEDLPGRVDLWPVVPPQEKDEERAWFDPLDRASPTHHNTQLAQRIASQIKAMLDPDTNTTIPDKDAAGQLVRRRVSPGDILILFQSRKLESQNSLFNAVIRALKEHDLPVAGADRLKVGAELAVRDLTALLSFLATQDDCLSLASALRSPLFGWSEKDLFDIAHGREKELLWQVLRQKECPATHMLKDLRAQVDFLRPYDLIERILTRHAGRRKILARLGREAEDGINALLAQALAYERTAVPSLTGFLVWLETGDLMIKRQVDSASDQIRVMTVHGAKGLEAPIVILPDCAPRTPQQRSQIVKVADVPVWKPLSDEMPNAVAATLEQSKVDTKNEDKRLLYVALTRAEKWLIVAAAGDLGKSADCWYGTVQRAFEAFPVVTATSHALEIERYAFAEWDAAPLVDRTSLASKVVTVPAFLKHPAPPPPPQKEVVSPSDLGGEKALPSAQGLDEETAKAYGQHVHTLLDRCTAIHPDQRGDMLCHLQDMHDIPDEAIAETLSVLDAAHLRHLFTQNVLSEVSLTAELGKTRLFGIADKLVIADTSVTVVDFKTNREIPKRPENCPEGILRQMGAYVHALQQIYPDKQVLSEIVWTKDASHMSLPHDLVIDALQRTQHLDASGPAT
ncbi:MAG: double-strand break repair helicase AddA [Roseobacter sp.]